MIKKKLRNKILNLRKRKYNDNIKINFLKFFQILNKKINLNNKKYIGGYFPVNYEINDLEILKELKKRKFIISFPTVSKKKSNGFL